MKLIGFCWALLAARAQAFGPNFFSQWTQRSTSAKNFAEANTANGLLPTGLICHDTVPNSGSRFMVERIINGTTAGTNWPFIVRIKVDKMFLCGGAILNEQWIVTAAHCLRNMNHVVVTLGDRSKLFQEEDEIQVTPDHFFIHPDFNPTSMVNDVALIKLNKAVPFTEKIQPVCLAKTVPAPGTSCFVAGWGATSQGQPADPATLEDEIIMPEPTTTPMFTPPKNAPPATMPPMKGALFAPNLRCSANTIDDRYGSRLYRSMITAGLFDRIILGQQVDTNHWKWIASLQGNCGVTLIAERWALSAAHCCSPSVIGKPITFGTTKLDGSGKDTKTVTIVDFQNHEQFGNVGGHRGAFINDICLLQLSDNVKANANIGPACLPSKRIDENFQGECFIAGWGTLAEGEMIQPDTLMEAAVPLVNHAKCSKIFKASVLKEHEMMCFGGNQTDSCQGDSGGPLICIENGEPVLHGITSFGKGCGRAGFPGIYVRVSSYIDWIDSTIQRMLARTSCGAVRSAYQVVGNDVRIDCAANKCTFSCTSAGTSPTVKKVRCINPRKQRWLPPSPKTGVIRCEDLTKKNACGPISSLFPSIDPLASVSCDGGKFCEVKCPEGSAPSHEKITCVKVAIRKTFPPAGTPIQCIKNAKPKEESTEITKATQHPRDQPFTNAEKPRMGCRNIRKHQAFRQFFKKNPHIGVDCQPKCSNGRACKRPDQSHCSFFCLNGASTNPPFIARCEKNKKTRQFQFVNRLTQFKPRC
ncbi:Oidioi.mRNA.OKI2018_I69.chr2.g4403.t1.cds [Oikopleura dioica]|uniref:Oidioi.mRNA.OKI2018_I69.chr2.g4403.t1.cds n=1 Tax=Oikopleura dioica TaxID=34765 RepID=A0ABN7T3U0_OIKDI|nr:Oidioi.mRNA.OKI2018_I69.chr2.g4403.t1.cds [Oikopleura dioica]